MLNFLDSLPKDPTGALGIKEEAERREKLSHETTSNSASSTVVRTSVRDAHKRQKVPMVDKKLKGHNYHKVAASSPSHRPDSIKCTPEMYDRFLNAAKLLGKKKDQLIKEAGTSTIRLWEMSHGGWIGKSVITKIASVIGMTLEEFIGEEVLSTIQDPPPDHLMYIVEAKEGNAVIVIDALDKRMLKCVISFADRKNSIRISSIDDLRFMGYAVSECLKKLEEGGLDEDVK